VLPGLHLAVVGRADEDHDLVPGGRNLVAGDVGEVGGVAARLGVPGVFCEFLAADLPGERSLIVWRSPLVAVFLNAFPYGSGHLLVLPVRHAGDLAEVAGEERTAL